MINNNEIDNFVNKIMEDNKLNKINNIYLSNKQIEILKKYSIDYINVVDISELIFIVEDYINDNYMYDDIQDLENLSQELAEFNYYNNTNK